MTSAAALLIAFSIPLVFLFIVYKLDLYKTGNYGNIAFSLAGGIAAYGIAFMVNPWMRDYGLVTRDTLVRFSAPILEEIFKGLILLYLIRRPSFTYFVDGAIYGFATGIGFAILENFEYILGSPETALSLAIARVLSTNLVHATGSGLIGIALGVASYRVARGFQQPGQQP
jgi:RsiW-degrading membrane proteinase PrsW (M82 family)